jgi:hypothetical protein
MATRSSWGKIRKLPSGYYQASHLTPERKRATAPNTFSTRKAASAWLAQQRTLIEQGKWVGVAKPNGGFLGYALHHIEIQTSTKGAIPLSNYLFKHGYHGLEPSNHRDGALSPFTLVRGLLKSGETEGWQIWRDFCEASQGKNRVRFSPLLRNLIHGN